MRFMPGILVARKYAGHISLDSELEWTPLRKRIMWYENDVGIVLESELKHHYWKCDVVKVLLPTGVAYIEAQSVNEIK